LATSACSSLPLHAALPISARVGITANELTTLVRAGELVRVRRGAYVLSAVFDGADLSERYRLRVLAVLRTRPATDRASHQSALRSEEHTSELQSREKLVCR